jgi:hypothetical protein
MNKLPADISDLPSNKKFGWFFFVISAIFSAYFYYKDLNNSFMAAGVIALSFAVISTTAPNILFPLNLLWFKFGLLLGRVVSPVVLGFIFFGLITPVALVLRLSGRDILGMKKKSSSTYWKAKTPISPDSFKDQF